MGVALRLSMSVHAYLMADLYANDGEEETVSLLDVIHEEKELQDAANAVLGGADDSNCTYSSVS